MTHGCCIDKACSSSTCMQLPAGETCGSCVHTKRCVAIFGKKREHDHCDFYPRRFIKREQETP